MAFTARKNNGRGHQALAEINITPLCDVLLVLLIIFMVTAPLLSQGIDVHLPQAKAPQIQQDREDMILSLRKEGDNFTLFLGDQPTPIGIQSLEQELKDRFANRDEKDLFLKADRDVRYGDVARIMAIAKLAGVQRIGMMTQPEPN
ncbi:MAG: biopolymer transporter ExbD [Deltaproteobacteria bacterium]|nr:biopolymer transporter ExbD [Deltaproteobacteria bacterium]